MNDESQYNYSKKVAKTDPAISDHTDDAPELREASVTIKGDLYKIYAKVNREVAL